MKTMIRPRPIRQSKVELSSGEITASRDSMPPRHVLVSPRAMKISIFDAASSSLFQLKLEEEEERDASFGEVLLFCAFTPYGSTRRQTEDHTQIVAILFHCCFQEEMSGERQEGRSSRRG